MVAGLMLGSGLGGMVPGTVGVIEVVHKGVLSGSLSLLSGEELVAGSEGIVSLVSGEGIDIPSIVGPGLGGGSLLGSVVVGSSSAGGGSLSGLSGIGGDVVKLESLLGGGIGLSTLSSSSVLSLPGISGGGSSGIAGSGESVGIPGGGLSGLGVGNTSGGGLLSPGTGGGGGLSGVSPGLVGHVSIMEIVVEVLSLMGELVIEAMAPVGSLVVADMSEAVVVVGLGVETMMTHVVAMETVSAMIVAVDTMHTMETVTVMAEVIEGSEVHVLAGLLVSVLSLVSGTAGLSLLLSGGSLRHSSLLASLLSGFTLGASGSSSSLLGVSLSRGSSFGGGLQVHDGGKHFVY